MATQRNGFFARPRSPKDRPQFTVDVLKRQYVNDNIDWYDTKDSKFYRRINAMHRYTVAWYGLEVARGLYVYARDKVNLTDPDRKPLNPTLPPVELTPGTREAYVGKPEVHTMVVNEILDRQQQATMMVDPMYYPKPWVVDFDGAAKGNIPFFNSKTMRTEWDDESKRWHMQDELDELDAIWRQLGDGANQPYYDGELYELEDGTVAPDFLPAQRRFEDACDANEAHTSFFKRTKNSKAIPVTEYTPLYSTATCFTPGGKRLRTKIQYATPLLPPDADPFESIVNRMTGIRMAQRADDVSTITEAVTDDAGIEYTMTPYAELELRTHYGMHETLQTVAYAIVEYPKELEKIVNLLTERWGKPAALAIRDAAASIVRDLHRQKEELAAIAA